ncbi:MAG: flagellin [Planctomycetes bacterium]|nr:flagellin [Planctomycetota bacterium]
MSLSLGANRAVLQSLRNFGTTNRDFSSLLKKLSTGRQINAAFDDPSGLVISEGLRAQVAGIRQSVRNIEHTTNLLLTAEAKLSQVSDLLVEARGLVVDGLNTGALTAEQIRADQAQIDNIVASVTSVGASARFAGKSLLNGEGTIRAVNVTDGIKSVTVNSARMGTDETERSYDVRLLQKLENATVRIQIDPNTPAVEGAVGTTTGVESFKLTGSLGSVTIELDEGWAVSDLRDEINLYSSDTGITATGGTASVIQLESEITGADGFITIDVVTGNELFLAEGLLDTPSQYVAGQSLTAYGRDAQIQIGSSVVTTSDNEAHFVTSDLDIEIVMDDDAEANNPVIPEGQILATVDLSGTLGTGIEGLGSDGVSLFTSRGTTYYDLNPYTFSLNGSGTPGGIQGGAEGLAVLPENGQLIVDEIFQGQNRSITLVDVSSATIDANQAKQFNWAGLTYYDGTIFGVGTEATTNSSAGTGMHVATQFQIRTIDPNTIPATTGPPPVGANATEGILVSDLRSATGVAGGKFTGMATNGEELFVAEVTEQKIHRFSMSGEYIGGFNIHIDGVNQTDAITFFTDNGAHSTSGANWFTELAVVGNEVYVLNNSRTAGVQNSIVYRVSLGVDPYSFDLVRFGGGSGMEVSLGGDASYVNALSISLPLIHPSFLGSEPTEFLGETTGGYLSSIVSGGDNDLSNNPTNALNIIDDVIQQISSARARVGALVSNTLQVSSRFQQTLDVQLTKTSSAFTDLDYASAAADLAGIEVLNQIGLNTLQKLQLSQSSILSLLG